MLYNGSIIYLMLYHGSKIPVESVLNVTESQLKVCCDCPLTEYR